MDRVQHQFVLQRVLYRRRGVLLRGRAPGQLQRRHQVRGHHGMRGLDRVPGPQLPRQLQVLRARGQGEVHARLLLHGVLPRLHVQVHQQRTEGLLLRHPRHTRQQGPQIG